MKGTFGTFSGKCKICDAPTEGRTLKIEILSVYGGRIGFLKFKAALCDKHSGKDDQKEAIQLKINWDK